MIFKQHIPFYEEILNIPGFLQDPVLIFGCHSIEKDLPPASKTVSKRLHRFVTSERKIHRLTNFVRMNFGPLKSTPAGFRYDSLSDLLRDKGCSVSSLDLFDSRADLRYDMNLPIPEAEYNKYATLIDIGCLEHLFDTAQCMENCLRMMRRGGHYMLVTPVNGYYGHGLHTFNPTGLIDCLGDNGYKIVYLKYSTQVGKPISDPASACDVIIWIVARKQGEMSAFACPQQKLWADHYRAVRTISA
jgi:hypothetical protein